MLDTLDDYLASATTPEIRTMVSDANEVFNRLNYEDCDARYQEIVMMEDVMELGDPVAMIVQFTCDQMENLLRLHGITVSDEADLSMMTKIMEGVLNLLVYDNGQEIISTIGAGDCVEETMAELLALTTDLSVDEALMYIHEVNPYFISQLKELMTVEEVEVEDFKTEDYLPRLVGYCTFRCQPELEILSYISQGLKFGYTFVTYADLIGRQLEAMPVERAADELIAMAIISSDGHHNPRAVITEHLENYVADPNKITKIMVLVSDLLLRFDA